MAPHPKPHDSATKIMSDPLAGTPSKENAALQPKSGRGSRSPMSKQRAKEIIDKVFSPERSTREVLMDALAESWSTVSYLQADVDALLKERKDMLFAVKTLFPREELMTEKSLDIERFSGAIMDMLLEENDPIALHISQALQDKNRAKSRRLLYAKHSAKGGSHDKHKKVYDAWASGKYLSRAQCSEKIANEVGLSPTTIRKLLTNTPNPKK